MEPWFFWIFAAGLLGSALSVVLNRGPVAAALSLVVSMVFLAALFVLLHAFFLAAVQVLVYAGAVMVLFLFIIMLLDLKALPPGRRRWVLRAGAFLVAAALAFLLTEILGGLSQPPPLPAETEVAAAAVSDVREVGELLFTRYLLPFEITGLLLLVAMIGVVVVSKKESTETQGPASS